MDQRPFGSPELPDMPAVPELGDGEVLATCPLSEPISDELIAKFLSSFSVSEVRMEAIDG